MGKTFNDKSDQNKSDKITKKKAKHVKMQPYKRTKV